MSGQALSKEERRKELLQKLRGVPRLIETRKEASQYIAFPVTSGGGGPNFKEQVAASERARAIANSDLSHVTDPKGTCAFVVTKPSD